MSYPTTNEAPPARPPQARRRANQTRNQQRRRRQRIARQVVRLLLVTAGGIVSAYLAFLFMGKVVHPYKLGYQVSQEVEGVQEELAAQRKQNAAMLAHRRYLESPEGAERMARREGFYRDGETVYLLRQ